jgi:putative ATP-dependent endonuclease of the OLD family
VRISRLRLHDFRGWADLDLRPRTHMLLAGVPRAGRSDIIVALTRLLDPAFIRVQPTLADVRQQRASAATGDDEDATTIDNGDADDKGTGDADDKDNGATTAPDDDAPTAKAEIEVAADSQGNGYTVAAYGEVEVTLVELDPELEQL